MDRLLRPASVDNFITNYFERFPFIVSNRSVSIYSDLLTLADFELLVRNLGDTGQDDGLIVARDGMHLPMREPLIDDIGRVVPRCVFEKYANGYSLVLTHLQRRVPSIRHACASIVDFFASNVGCISKNGLTVSAFLTPANTKGYNAHYDANDAFVLQIDGAKRWKVYAEYSAASVAAQANLPEGLLGPPMLDITLLPGDLLYIPKRFPHRAWADSRHSLHLTISLTFMSYLEICLGSVRTSDLFRIPVNTDGPDGGKTARLLRDDLIANVAKSMQAMRARRYVERRAERTVPDGCLTRINAGAHLAPETELVLSAEGLRISRHNESFLLELEELRKHFPPQTLEAFQLLCQVRRFRVADIALPEAEERLAFAKRLLFSGLVDIRHIRHDG
jgi:hypothetical protein